MRNELLDAAERLVQDRGLTAVSFQNLADEVGLRKPSVFHHFPTKAALASALVDRCQSKYGPEYAAIADSDLPAPDKLRAVARHFEFGLRDERLCLLGSLGHAVASLAPEVQDELRTAIESSIRRFSVIFEQGRAEGSLCFEGKPRDAAAALLAMLQGLQILARAHGNAKLFRAGAAAYVESLVADA